MPYNRRYTKRRPYRRRTRRRPAQKQMGGAQFALWMAQQAMKNIRYIKKLVNAEKHNNDVTITASSHNTGTVVGLSAIAQGDTATTRTGNSLLTSSISVRGQISASATAGSAVRIMLFQDKQQGADSEPTAQVLLNTPDQIDSFLNSTTKGRFTVLYDRVFNVGGTDTSTEKRWLNFTIPLSQHIRFNGTASTDIQKNGLYLLHMSDQTDGSGQSPILNLSTRLYFYDN